MYSGAPTRDRAQRIPSRTHQMKRGYIGCRVKSLLFLLLAPTQVEGTAVYNQPPPWMKDGAYHKTQRNLHGARTLLFRASSHVTHSDPNTIALVRHRNKKACSPVTYQHRLWGLTTREVYHHVPKQLQRAFGVRSAAQNGLTTPHSIVSILFN